MASTHRLSFRGSERSEESPEPITVGVDGPRRHRMCQNEVVEDLKQGEPSMTKIIRVGVDTSKTIFVLHGVDAAEKPVLRRKLRRRQFLEFFGRLEPTKIGMEACGATQHWARE